MSRFTFLVLIGLIHASASISHEDARCKEPANKCVVSTKVFTMKVEPQLFKWNSSDAAPWNPSEKPERYKYRASLLGSPDLPSWMHYVYSKRHHSGFIYGTPPVNESDFTLEIVAVDHDTYDTSHRIIEFIVLPRSEAARNKVHLKIYNLALEDLFEPQYLDDLLSIFRAELWPEAARDLHVSFFASAVHQGGRYPVHPEEKEGVVIFLGSSSKFSDSLLRLQNETNPLEKLRKQASCPRDFKRTTVDRLFRQLNFEMDWCFFRLESEGQHEKEDSQTVKLEPSFTLSNLPLWHSQSQWDAPERSYVHEFLLSILVPMLVMILLAVILSLILCFHHEGMDDGSSDYFDSIFDICEDVWGNKRNQETPAVQMVRYAAVQRATSTLRSLSAQRDPSPALSRLAPESNDVFRPHPPPYSSGTRSSKIDF